jgi:hypothetical protein
MAAQVEVADVPTEEYAQAMEEAIDAATKAERERDSLDGYQRLWSTTWDML